MMRIGELATRLGLRVHVGEDALSREVRSAPVSELRDPTRYLAGGELLLTAGLSLPEAGDEVSAYVERLAGAGVAGLGLGLGPVHTAVPAALRDACRAHGLPLLTIPPDMAFITVADLVAEVAFARGPADAAGVRRMSESQRALIRAARSETPVQAVVSRLADALRAWVVLFDRRLGRSWRAGEVPTPLPEQISALVERVSHASSPMAASTMSDGAQVDVQPVRGPRLGTQVLAIGRHAPPDPVDRTILTLAVSLLSMLAEDPHAHGDAAALGAAVAILLGGGSSGAAETAFHDATGAGAAHRWRVFRIGRPRGKPPTAAACGEMLGSRLAASDSAGVYVLRPDDNTLPASLAVLERAGAVAGVSQPVSWSQVPAALDEARHARQAAMVKGQSVVAGQTPGSGVAGLVEANAARAYAVGLLGPLAESEETTGLLATLRVWLDHNGSWERTAAELGVHRNTVRSRLAQIERLLGTDLSSMRARAELWFALEWLASTPPEPPPAGPVGPGAAGPRDADQAGQGRSG
jgi:hypothetical protein